MLIAPVELLEDKKAKKILSIMYIKTAYDRRFITDMDFIVNDIIQEEKEKHRIITPIHDIYVIFKDLVYAMLDQSERAKNKNLVTPIEEISYTLEKVTILNNTKLDNDIYLPPIQKLLTIVRMNESRLKAKCVAISKKKINKLYDELNPYIKMERLK